MKDLIIILIVLAIIAVISLYIYKEKKRGTKCIGCPHAGKCASRNGCSCGGKS